MNDQANVLTLSGLTKRYGAVVAIDQVSMEIVSGERHAVIGPNGAGKSTLFAVAAGTLPATSGRVTLLGDDITRLRDYERARRGLVKTFQHSSLFPSMSVRDNVLLATQRLHGVSANPFDRRKREAVLAAGTALELAGISHRANALTGSLSHGERRQVELALALGLRPAVLLLDEPTAGMSAAETAAFVHFLRDLPRSVTVLIIEHDLDVVFTVADRVTVLDLGAVIAAGTPEEIRRSDVVQRTYLGVSSELGLADVDAQATAALFTSKTKAVS